MISPQNHEFSIAENLSGSVSKWYADVDNCLAMSEVIPGQYEYTTSTSYGNSGGVNENASTFLDIQADRFKLVSIDNSFALFEHTYIINVPKQDDMYASVPNKGIYYVGQLYGPAAIGAYRIRSNTDEIQTVNHANYEWFLQYQSTPDEVKENNENYATIKKIREMNPMVPGAYVDLSKITAGTEVKVPIKIKVPLNSFLLLKNLKWLPSWMGKLTIEIIPTYKNLVVCPVLAPELPAEMIKTCNENPTVNLGFHNINTAMFNKFTTDWQFSNIKPQLFKCDDAEIDKCQIRCATYILKMDVFNQLDEQYMQVPLLFPIQTVQAKDFQNAIKDNEHFDTAMTVQLNQCDSAYTVFKKNNNTKMCFENPCINYQFNIDGKFYPREPYNSVSDHRSLNYTLDALNVNGSNLTSIGEDLRTSLQPYTWINDVADSTGTITRKKLNSTGAKNNFMIGIPFTDSEDFGGGISTSGTVQIQLVGQGLSENDGATDKPGERIKFGHPVTIFTEDAILKIRSMKPAGRPQMEITRASVEQIIGRGA